MDRMRYGITQDKNLKGINIVKILVTGGSTRVMIDKVRCIGNIFKGKTACDIVNYLVNNKNVDHVTLIGNPHMESKVKSDINIDNISHSTAESHSNLFIKCVNNKRTTFIPYQTYDELYEAMRNHVLRENYDIIIHSAAVSDYMVSEVTNGKESVSAGKISSNMDEMYIKLVPTEKIIDRIRDKWSFSGKLVKFKLQVDMSDSDLLEIANKSMNDSKADFIVANCLEWAKERAYIISENKTLSVERKYLPNILSKELGL